MTRAERLAFAAARDAYEAPLIEAARAAGRLPVIDCTVKGYPVPPAELRELERLEHPDSRAQHYRDAAGLRRKATKHRGLALMLDEGGKHDQAEALRAKALLLDGQAHALEEAVRN